MDNNNKKRRRLESTTLGALGSNMEALASFAGSQDAIMLSAGQSTENSIDLGAALPANLYFTICDDISNESHEYLAINSNTAITQIKEEPKREPSICDQPLHYRIVSQVPKTSVNNTSSSSTSTTAVTLRAVALDGSRSNTSSAPVNAASLLPATTTVQLPSGCEIYLVKEYVDSDGGDILLSEDCEDPSSPDRLALPQSVTVSNNATQTVMKSAAVSILPRASIKTEPGTQTQFLGSNVITSKIENTALKVTAGSVAASNYKKRDEKRRATHNEVERRRRDKINSWIFKLKEMLPTDVSNCSLASKSKACHTRNLSNSGATRLPTTALDGVDKSQQPQQAHHRGGNNCRSPPNDSKSQILIKACEYIRAMQDEVKSLRECLMENEKLRTSNVRLQNELQRLKNTERRRFNHEQQEHTCDDSFNNSNNCSSPSEDFTLTLCTNGNSHLDDVTSSSFFTTTPTSPTSIALINSRKASITVPYTKRELIITDYVD